MASHKHRMALVFTCSMALCLPLIASAQVPVRPAEFRYDIYSETAVELFWNRTVNVPVQGYEITRNGESLGVYDALSYYDDTLSAGVDYTYTITAIAVDGERSDTSTVSLRPPQSADDIATLQRQVASLQLELQQLQETAGGTVRSPVPQTGQSVSVLPGDDGDVQAGIAWPDPRFTLNVDSAEDTNENGVCDDIETCNGTVTDNLTGLVWLQNANCFDTVAWIDAINEVNSLAGDGSSNCGLADNSQIGDWRLPNIKEILSLMDYGQSFPDALLPVGHPFIDVQIGGINALPSSYWTSTSTGSGSDAVYSVSLSVGWVERLSIDPDSSFFNYVLPVRGGL